MFISIVIKCLLYYNTSFYNIFDKIIVLIEIPIHSINNTYLKEFNVMQHISQIFIMNSTLNIIESILR